MVTKKKDSVVKIDSCLLEKVQEFIDQENNKYSYINKKQFIDLAVYEKLKREMKNNDKKF